MRIFNASVGRTCKLCGKPFKEGEKTTLLNIGPADEEERAKKEVGKPYNAEAVEVHIEHLEDL